MTTVVPGHGLPAMGFDRHWRCDVNPAFVDATPVHELAAAWVHEIAVPA